MVVKDKDWFGPGSIKVSFFYIFVFYDWLSTSVLGGRGILINFIFVLGCRSGTGKGWGRDFEIALRSR